MACKDSDYTIVIAIMHCPNFGAETHLGGGDMSAFLSPLAAIARALHRLSGAVPFLGKTHEHSDHTAVIAVIH